MGKIFSNSEDNLCNEKAAFMNFRLYSEDESSFHIHNMATLAEGFMLSSLYLTKQMIEDQTDMQEDILIFPVLFNANHAIEVYLKAISWALNLLNDTEDKFRQTHLLKELLDNVKCSFIDYETDENNVEKFTEGIKPLEEFINEIYEKTKGVTVKGKEKYNIDFPRYTLNIDYKPQFYVKELDNVAVKLVNLYATLGNIHRTLKGLKEYCLTALVDKCIEENKEKQAEEL
ncbi:hypothetical protein [Priestia aryabhattai]